MVHESLISVFDIINKQQCKLYILRESNFRDMQMWAYSIYIKLICIFKLSFKETCNTKKFSFHVKIHCGKFQCDRTKEKKSPLGYLVMLEVLAHILN